MVCLLGERQTRLRREAPGGRARRKGGGDKPKSEKDPTLVADLKRIVEPVTLGSPVQPLTWVSKSHAKLARALTDMGHAISAGTGFKSSKNTSMGANHTARMTGSATPSDTDAAIAASALEALWRPGT